MMGKDPTLFNGVSIWRGHSGDILVRRGTKKGLEKFEGSAISFEEFRSVRSRGAYVAHSAAQVILYNVAHLSQVTIATFKSSEHIKYCRPDPLPTTALSCFLAGELEVAVCIYASFASNDDYSSQLGVLFMLREIRDREVQHNPFRQREIKKSVSVSFGCRVFGNA